MGGGGATAAETPGAAEGRAPRSSRYWEPNRDLELLWGGALALPGLLAYAAIVIRAWRGRPHLSAGRLLAMQGAALALTRVALRLLRAPGVLVGAPAAGLLASAVARRAAAKSIEQAV